MLDVLLSKITGLVSKKWLIGRRMVLDFTSSNEKRVSVIVLPEGSFSFDLKKMNNSYEIRLESVNGSLVLASFDDQREAEKVIKALRFKLVRPLKKIVMACLGVMIVLFTLDLASVHRDNKMYQQSPRAMSSSLPNGLPVSNLNSTQIEALKEQMQRMNAPQSLGNASSEGKVKGSDASNSSPEAQAAMRLLEGK